MEYRDDDDGSLIWFITGVALGAAVAMLYAPRPGRELRDFLVETAGEALDLITPQGHGFDSQEVLDEAADMVGGGGPRPATAPES